ncbi:MAG TPA: hypothetical protein VGK93_02995, partial [Candidatus Eisenbacteria bacterium]
GRRVLAGLLSLGVLAGLGCAAGGGRTSFAVNPSATRSESYAQRLLRRRCQGCHQVPHPENLDAQTWREALTRMQQRIHLPAADWDSLAALGSPDSSAAGAAR